LVKLSDRLAPIERAPVTVIGRLSQDDDIAIAGPVLERSAVLTDDDLIKIAKTKSQAHLSAIAGRASIAELVTDVLIDRGDTEVARKVTANAGARFSRFGFDTAVRRGGQDDSLALAIAERADLPPEVLKQLVRKATATVRERLMSNARPELRRRISDVLAAVSSEVASAVTPRQNSARTTMRPNPAELRARIAKSADSRKVDEMIDALAVLSETPVKAIKGLIRNESEDGLIVIGKACGLGWPEMQKILTTALPSKKRTQGEFNALFGSYSALSMANAQRATRFMKTGSSKFVEGIRTLL
jgi:hypothetical protein